MERAMGFIGTLVLGVLLLIKMDLLDDTLALVRPALEPEGYMSKSNPFALDYDPATNEDFYLTCDEAIRAGKKSIQRGEEGYRLELDSDGDGIACEPYHRR